MKKRSFTIIELLIVAGLIVFMSAMLLSGISGAFTKNSQARTKDVILKTDIAIRSYKKNHDDGLMPFYNTWTQGALVADGTELSISANLVALEKFEEVISKDQNGTWAILDAFESEDYPNGRPLWIMFSQDYMTSDNTDLSQPAYTTDGYPAARKVPIVDQYYEPEGYHIISAGPDGDFDTDNDNIYNFNLY